jgi:phosphomevalonate decarboxylase
MRGKASAVAYPIQGLVKYHGLRDPVRRIPFHDSVSLCTGPIHTHTTVQVLDGGGDGSATIDGRRTAGRPLERVRVVMDAVREKAGDDRPYRMESRNDFPQFVGLGSSSSGFAALAVAAAAAYGWDATPEQLSEVARLGAGSASRAVTGGISEWVVEGERSFARCLAPAEELGDWRIVVPLVQHEEPTENVHAEVTSSPFFEARNQYVASALGAIRKAVASRSVREVAPIAERDTLNLHAVTMTAQSGHLTWMPATVEVMHRTRRLRQEGVPVWFSIDTGATAYLNTDAAHEERVAAAVEGIAGVERILRLRPGGPARLVDRHLF